MWGRARACELACLLSAARSLARWRRSCWTLQANRALHVHRHLRRSCSHPSSPSSRAGDRGGGAGRGCGDAAAPPPQRQPLPGVQGWLWHSPNCKCKSPCLHLCTLSQLLTLRARMQRPSAKLPPCLRSRPCRSRLPRPPSASRWTWPPWWRRWRWVGGWLFGGSACMAAGKLQRIGIGLAGGEDGGERVAGL